MKVFLLIKSLTYFHPAFTLLPNKTLPMAKYTGRTMQIHNFDFEKHDFIIPVNADRNVTRIS